MLQDYFITEFTVKRASLIDDDGGAFTQSFTNVLTAKGCFYQTNSNLTVTNEKVTVDSGHRLTCPVLDIRALDIITVSGNNYKVKSKPDNVMGMNHHLQIELEPEN